MCVCLYVWVYVCVRCVMLIYLYIYLIFLSLFFLFYMIEHIIYMWSTIRCKYIICFKRVKYISTERFYGFNLKESWFPSIVLLISAVLVDFDSKLQESERAIKEMLIDYNRYHSTVYFCCHSPLFSKYTNHSMIKSIMVIISAL